MMFYLKHIASEKIVILLLRKRAQRNKIKGDHKFLESL